MVFAYSNSTQAQKLQKIDQLLFQKKYPEAIQLLEQKTSKDSLQPRLFYRLGRAHQSLQQNRKAISAFQKALELDSLYISNRLALGNCYFSSGMYPDAQTLLESTYQLDSTNASNNLLLAKVYTVQKEYKKAIHLYKGLIVKDSINPYYHKQYGILAEKLYQPQIAIDHLKTAYELNTRDLGTLVKLISTYYQYAVYQKALLYCNKGLKDFPNNFILLKKKAQLLINLKWFENAQVVLEKIRQLEKADDVTYKQLGLCYLNAKDYEKALEALQSVGPKSVNDPMVNLYLGITLQKLGRHKESLEKFEDSETFSIPPYMASLKLYQARAYGFVKQFDKSVKAYIASWELDKDSPNILYDIATTYEEFGNHKKEAINYYSQYLNLYQGKDEKRKEYARSRILHLKERIHFEK
jgi:tetratricopeptide (TPR) repeat protein